MNRPLPCAFGLLALAFPITASACEPILPLAQLLSGSSAVGPLHFTHSFLWLALAIALKCGAFVFFEKRLSWGHAVGLMLFANIVSTIPGIFIAGLTSSVVGIVPVLPVIFAMGWMVRHRLLQLTASSGNPRTAGLLAALAFFLIFVASLILYGFADSLMNHRSYATYWPIKFLFVGLVASTGIVISSVLEEFVIARLTRIPGRALSFYTSVIRANYVTLGAILLVGAIMTLPERLRSPGFLLGWLDQVRLSLGIA